MNKQELIKEVSEIAVETPFPDAKIVDFLKTIKLIEQLDEPQKPVVPQFVADWYEEYKGDLEYNVWEWFVHGHKKSLIGYKRKFFTWLNSATGNPIQTLVNMHQFGYTVEKEKRYLVKMKGISSNMCYLNRVGNKWIIAGIDEHTGMNIYTKHTKKQLEEAGFGWVFDCPGIEVEEVE